MTLIAKVKFLNKVSDVITVKKTKRGYSIYCNGKRMRDIPIQETLNHVIEELRNYYHPSQSADHIVWY